MIDPELLKMLACPACRKPLEERAERKALVCAACRKAYPIEDGIPTLLAERAQPL